MGEQNEQRDGRGAGGVGAMATSPGGAGPELSRRRALLFRAAAAVFVVAIILGVAELALRLWESKRIGVQQIDPGFLSYDETLGWTLTPHWRGRHQYAGFDVAYAVDGDGLRVEGAPLEAPRVKASAPGRDGGAKRTVELVVGDSFTFGIGVGDGETFVAESNRRSTNGLRRVNLGVPGYSTDQEVLLAERELTRRPGEIRRLTLAVCLANDLLDNPRAFPIQGHLAKPRFDIVGAVGLQLTNVPVSRLPKPPWNSADELAAAMLGAKWVPDGWVRWSRRSALVRYIHREFLGLRGPTVVWGEGHRREMDLFWRMVGRLREECRRGGVEFRLLLIPGGALVLHPESVAGQYQELARQQILGAARANGVEVVDPVPALAEVRRGAGRGSGALFLNDGHLSREGHRLVADALLGW